MAGKEEDVNEEGMLGGLREMVQQLQEMISQDEVESNLNEKKDVGQGGENKLNSDETSNEQQGTSDHQLAGLSTTYNVLVAYKQSDVANLETRNVPVSSGEAVSSLSVPSSELASKYNLPDDEQVTNPVDYSSSDYDAIRDQLSQLSIENDDDSDDASLKQYVSKIDSASSDHLEAEQAQYGTHEHAPVNPTQAPPKPRLQRQNAMPRQRHTRELDPGYSASYLNQSMPTRDSITSASSHGRRPPISMTKALTTATDFVPQRNQQAMNPHYSQRQVLSGQYGNIMNEDYNNMPPSAAAFQQHGGSNMAYNGNITNSPYLPPAAAAAPQQLGGSTNNTSAHYDSRFGYEGGVSRNHLPPIQQRQSTGDSNVWRPSPRRIQRQQQLRSDFFASLNQQNDRSDPSDQTQERSWPKRDN
ncbi:uncharacterized protein LOC108828324 isoform X2 [Raphanus sativus]|uniref:Uncharacterized protein LOC108828324 isoform X2 n=1 Tax=Raphanus sativus TaxID=3726 RepID=A0A9W3CE94_RAPSA|nr:uncharacterized protein LOC108828324 isoform X2 [Raphanus sativus]